LLSRARALANQLQRPDLHALVQLAEGLSNYLSGNLHTALRLLRQAERAFVDRCVDVSFELNLARLFALRAQLYMGQLRAMREVYVTVMRGAEERNDRLLMGHLRCDAFVLLDLASDQPDEADRKLEASQDDLQGAEGVYQLGFVMRGRVNRLLYDGRVAEAVQFVERTWPRVDQPRRYRTALARVLLLETRAIAHLALDEPGRRRAVAWAKELLNTEHRAAPPLGHLVLGAVHDWRGRMEASEASFAQAERAFDRLEMHVYAAVARRRRGLAMGGERGAALVRSADGWLENEGVVNVPRFTGAICPDFRVHPG